MWKKLGTVVVLALGLFVIRASAASAEQAPRIEEKRGCCSHHGGVCGCSEGRAKCCDGQLSPSCGC